MQSAVGHLVDWTGCSAHVRSYHDLRNGDNQLTKSLGLKGKLFPLPFATPPVWQQIPSQIINVFI